MSSLFFCFVSAARPTTGRRARRLLASSSASLFIPFPLPRRYSPRAHAPRIRMPPPPSAVDVPSSSDAPPGTIPPELVKRCLLLRHPNQRISNDAVRLSSEFLKRMVIEARRRAAIEVRDDDDRRRDATRRARCGERNGGFRFLFPPSFFSGADPFFSPPKFPPPPSMKLKTFAGGVRGRGGSGPSARREEASGERRRRFLDGGGREQRKRGERRERFDGRGANPRGSRRQGRRGIAARPLLRGPRGTRWIPARTGGTSRRPEGRSLFGKFSASSRGRRGRFRRGREEHGGTKANRRRASDEPLPLARLGSSLLTTSTARREICICGSYRTVRSKVEDVPLALGGQRGDATLKLRQRMPCRRKRRSMSTTRKRPGANLSHRELALDAPDRTNVSDVRDREFEEQTVPQDHEVLRRVQGSADEEPHVCSRSSLWPLHFGRSVSSLFGSSALGSWFLLGVVLVVDLENWILAHRMLTTSSNI
ncbi:hypothetical protein ACHAWF_007393 [Thalassiosira exigua]